MSPKAKGIAIVLTLLASAIAGTVFIPQHSRQLVAQTDSGYAARAKEIRGEFATGDIPACSIVEVARSDGSDYVDRWMVFIVDPQHQNALFIDNHFDGRVLSFTNGADMDRIVRVIRKGDGGDKLAYCMPHIAYTSK